ncbi:MAG: peptidase M23, partial [Gammaproteobacteria bacterium]|nr:peptidase M23 [Gammaproteobacteria bacterium]
LFGSNNKGLDYAITARSRVRSTRSGEVVYAGNGIAGFERLVIVKHTTDLLSAYSFNGKIRVAEQQRISGGVIIAEILPRPGVGQKLHFEVRRKGQPINPAMLLPKS